jgi:aminopeptidase-like protein
MDKKQFIKYLEEMYPIMRSITGKGLRKTYGYVDKICKMDRMEFKSGTKVSDWEIPQEWDFNKAEIKDLNGKVLITTDDHLLHVWNYSCSFEGEITKEELEKKVICGDDCIPYITRYFEKDWGFSMTTEQWESLPDKVYVKIDANHFDGVMDIAFKNFEKTQQSFLLRNENIIFSTYCCHPMMASNNLVGIIVNAYLAKYVKSLKNRKNNYTFLFAPETIGSIAWLEKGAKRRYDKACVVHCIGPNQMPIVHTYKPGYGADERQYGLNGAECLSYLNVKPQGYFEYHNSMDNLGFINIEMVKMMYDLYVNYIDVLEINHVIRRKFNYEPCLKKYKIDMDIEERARFMNFWDSLAPYDSTPGLLCKIKKSQINASEGLRFYKLLEEKNLIWQDEKKVK